MTDYEYIIQQTKIFNLLFKERIEERDRKIKAMSVDELIEKLAHPDFSVADLHRPCMTA